MDQKRRVVITGLGAVSPLGNTATSTWEAAKKGRSGIGRITRFDAAAFATQIAGEVKDFDPTTVVEAKEVKKLDPYSQFTLAAGQEAWDDSGLGLPGSGFNSLRSGSIIGVGIGGIYTLEKYHQAYLEGGPRKISPFLIPGMISNLAPGHLGIRFGLRAVNYTITSACTSGTHALGEAFHMIRSGRVDCIMAGGAESAVTPIGIGGFCALRAMSVRNEEPEKASRPFDKDRDGFVMGEGSIVLILEEREQAIKRGAKIYAEVTGYAASCDAFHITGQCADGDGAVRCMSDALKDAELAPEAIQYINAHGTSTDINDKTETLAIKRVFGDYAKNGLLVSSTKSMTGHLLGGAGAIEGLFCAMALQDQVAPPTINLDNPAADCDLDYVPHIARATRLEAVLSNSFGFGGTNASIIFQKAD